MKTEVILSRAFADSSVRQLSKSGFFCATDITTIYNVIRVGQGKAEKQMQNYFESSESQEFIASLCNELNLLEKAKTAQAMFASNSLNSLEETKECKVWIPADLKTVKRGKNNKGTWLHPYLFIDYAMWLSPDFRAKVVIWAADNLLGLRDQSGNAFKAVNHALDTRFSIGTKYWEYAKVAKFVAMRIIGSENTDQWNDASEEQLSKRTRLLTRIESACEFGSFDSIDELLTKI